jgi:hypothetical protein
MGSLVGPLGPLGPSRDLCLVMSYMNLTNSYVPWILLAVIILPEPMVPVDLSCS